MSPRVLVVQVSVELDGITLDVYAVEIWEQGFRVLASFTSPDSSRAGPRLIPAVQAEPPIPDHSVQVGVERSLGFERAEWTVALDHLVKEIRIGGQVVYSDQ